MVALAAANLLFVVTLCHAESVRSARFVSSPEGATTPASTLYVRHLLVYVFADDTEQTAGHNQFCKSRSAPQQCVARCAAWFAHSKEVME